MHPNYPTRRLATTTNTTRTSSAIRQSTRRRKRCPFPCILVCFPSLNLSQSDLPTHITQTQAMAAQGDDDDKAAAPPPPSPPPATHVVFVVPGLWGRPVDLQVVATTVEKRLAGTASLVVVSAVNALFRSYHGIDVCGARLAEEIKALLLVHPELTHLSFVCYSAGGLFARYAIGLLLEEGILGKDKLQPLAFITLATPHLGCRDLAHTAQGRRRNSVQAFFSDFYSYRSGIQMMLLDQDTGSHLPLLLQMALPSSSFYQALAMFQHVAFYANANNDHIVHYATAAIAPFNPYLEASVPPAGYTFVVKETRVDLEGKEETTPTDIEETEMEVVGQPPVSHYGRMHPLALPVLMPFIVVHALLLMTPLRILAGATASAAGAGAGDKEEGPLHHDHPQVHVDEVPELIRKHLIALPIHRVDVYLPGMHTHGTIIVRRPIVDKDGREVVMDVGRRLERVLGSLKR